MFDFPKISMIRITKLITHATLLVIALTFISLLSADIAGWMLGITIEVSKAYLVIIVIIWLFFAMQNKRYIKQK